MAAWWALLLLRSSWPCGGAGAGGSEGRGRERDAPAAAAERDGWDRERDRDFLYYGGLGYKDRDYYGMPGSSYSDYYGSSYRDYYSSAKDFGSERGDSLHEDDCHRLEANGVPLADALREAAELLANSSAGLPAPELHALLAFFSGTKHRRLLLAHCPQAVVLAALLQAELSPPAAAPAAEAADLVQEMLSAAPGLRSTYRAPPQWTGAPWEPLLHAVQRRTGIVVFPLGEQQFHVERVAVADWAIHPRRRCVGRRDLGNLQGTPLARCLAKCMSHPLCKSATFWHWQPGGFGFEQRCFLSSTCTAEAHATAEGAEGAALFEKRGGQSPREEALVRRTVVTPGGAPWAPRCGHRMIAASAGGHVQLWVLGGVGVDAFANASTSPGEDADEGDPWGLDFGRGPAGGSGVGPSGGAHTRSKGVASLDRDPLRPSSERPSPAHRDPPKKREPNATGSNAVEAYLSRHVELNGELPPLRSLPYGRLPDVWRSDDLGSSWSLVTSEAPWGRRAFFGAVAVQGGRALLILGGVLEPAATEAEARGSAEGAFSAALPREYTNDVWWAPLEAGSAAWRQLAPAPWTPRAGFQALPRALAPASEGGPKLEEVLVLGGRSADGSLMSDVWVGTLGTEGEPDVRWRQLTAAAPWVPRADFAAAAVGATEDVWILGGCDQAGHPLGDVWRSVDGGRTWHEAVHSAPWGPRVGAAAVALDAPGEGATGPVVIFGGYAYPDAVFTPAPAAATEAAPLTWAAASWVSYDGAQWAPLNMTRMSWTPNAMHTALVAAPCSGNRSLACAYAAGGLTHEGYYDNSVHRLLLSTAVRAALETARAVAAAPEGPGASSHPPSAASAPLGLPAAAAATVALLLPLATLGRCCCSSARQNGLAAPGRQKQTLPLLDPRIRCALCVVCGVLVLVALVVAYLVVALARLSRDLDRLRTEAPRCQVGGETTGALLEALGLQTLTEQWDEFGTLLRLALREPQFGYGSLGGYHDYWKPSGRAGDALGPYGGRGYERGYGFDGGYGHGGPHYGDDVLPPQEPEAGASRAAEVARRRELALLPTTQGLSCRSPRCDRNASACAGGVARSLASPYGCCNDYMLIMLRDVTEWLEQQRVPYFVTYGTLLGALRNGEILPYTQDMDIVVDRAYWPQLQRGLEAAEFFGGRRYLFGVDQWEERVSRVCADWQGFAASTIGGPDGDQLSRGTEFHLDVYASDWWQIKDLHLIDCVEPLGSAVVPIRGQNFSAPARPRACVEKLYGADWRTPKQALSGVN